MKRTFPNILWRIGGAIVLLSAVAFLLIAIVKILVMALIVAGIGAIAFKIVRRQRNHWLIQPDRQLALQDYQSTSLAIQPLQRTTSRRNAAIIPIQ